MKQWQKDAIQLFRETRRHATRTSNTRLHLLCSRSIEAMVMEGGMVPSDLRIYARETRETYELFGAPEHVLPAAPLAG
jgi:hypothetical protein